MQGSMPTYLWFSVYPPRLSLFQPSTRSDLSSGNLPQAERFARTCLQVNSASTQPRRSMVHSGYRSHVPENPNRSPGLSHIENRSVHFASSFVESKNLCSNVMSVSSGALHRICHHDPRRGVSLRPRLLDEIWWAARRTDSDDGKGRIESDESDVAQLSSELG
ncbi:hypothetical protein BO79DRAFT_28296 [Aspergillus costaricaensis CBS 115574]|uniref:Uncharacterized protein n=1 Tax=Aspergillus costaricaensis CBS 115574 TaxID=1448317 RepID=A0ACD1IAZ1_9EURO|nr:hypothetical protein BO79DRAFT_28296 [Aspergillus costaricaensis CBS 115574]RAK87518.1 hypothetical protein BO79DRAFT_28296 [Aspergillus costaricaensis CBS 115574]